MPQSFHRAAISTLAVTEQGAHPASLLAFRSTFGSAGKNTHA